jgi:signal transduction histidine kinase
MTPKLCLAVCQGFQAEARAAVAAEGWDDVQEAVFPARCGRPALDQPTLAAALPPGSNTVLVQGSACLAGLGEPAPGNPPQHQTRLAQCFHLVAGEQLVDEAIASGAHLVTPGWLAHWQAHLAEMGLTPAAAPGFFAESAHELVLLDTGIDSRAQAHAADFAQAVKLPLRRLGVGLDATRQRLARLVLQWRLDGERASAQAQRRQHVRELADHVSAMDMLARLARLHDEPAAVAAVCELFSMLFAPEAVHHVALQGGVCVPTGEVPAPVLAALQALQQPHAWAEDGRGFLLRLGQGEQAVGAVAVLGLTFPAQRERYLNMALAMGELSGLAIDNARIRRKLLESEKMASLSLVVAGVAHEISTPLGIDRLACTQLQGQLAELERHFAARSLKQSELALFMQRAAESTALISTNLERIGRLIDAFRQVAITGRRPEAGRFSLRDCMDEVMRSLQGRLDAARVDVRIRCDPALQIDGHVDDWVCVFGNLVRNSIQHGFKERACGVIDVAVEADDRLVRVDYRDDGQGMSAAACARVFDPFFTTDLQQGMGLGMHLVYNLVGQRFGGEIRCDSRPGEGVHFHFEAAR